MAEDDEYCQEVCIGNLCFVKPYQRYTPPSYYPRISRRLRQQRSSSEDGHRDGISNPRKFRVGFSPRACLKVTTPVFGKLALQPMVDLIPTRTLMLRRRFRVGTSKLSLQANLEVAAGLAEVPANFIHDGASRLLGSLPLRARVDSCKVSYIITDKAARTAPLTTSAYLKASKKIGTSDFISIIPGHWVDPGFETGAPGERDFNMDLANMLERKLIANGWKVLRPDRDSPNLTWEEYLNWVSKKTSQGIPVLEIHGQGSKADHRGLVLGAIGDSNASLNKELAKDFGYFSMNWRGLGVPKRGGVILESFDSDEVLQMAPWHRKWSVRRIASRIVTCIERAGHENRVSRGVIIETDSDDEILALDNALVKKR